MATSEPRASGTALFDAVVRFYGDSLFRFVRRMVGANVADDVMQETFLKIYQALPTHHCGARFRDGIFGIVGGKYLFHNRTRV